MTTSKTINLVKQKAKFIEYYRRLPIQKLAAASIGKDEDTIIHWKHADADFADQTGVAKAEWALENTSKVKSVEWLLERVMKDHFAPKIETGHEQSPEIGRVMQYVRNALTKKEQRIIQNRP